MRRVHVILSLVLTGLALFLGPIASVRGAFSTVSVERPIIHAPVPIPAGSTVTVTSRIRSGHGCPQVIPSGVYLLRLDSANRFVANLGVMHDDGMNGDGTAGDGIFSLRFKVPSTPGELRVQVSAPFKGLIRRVFSEVATAEIVGNRPPSANAGPDRTVKIGATIQLDGSGSSDPDGDALRFSWSLLSAPDGSQAALVNPTAVRPTFVPDVPGTYAIRLVVSDGKVNSADTVVIRTENSAPVANAGADQAVAAGATVVLNGSASGDANGDPLTFSWNFVSKPAGSTALLDDPSSVNPRFVADLAGTYALQLVVNDGQVSSTPDTVAISTQNTAPVASAGPDQRVSVGQSTTLDGSGSSDADQNALTFSWSFTVRPAGSSAALSSTTAVSPSFVADAAGTYVVQLIVNDGQLNSPPDTVTITTDNTRPVANAGPDQTIGLGAVVQLNGSASSDIDGDALTFAWSFVSRPGGSVAALSDPAAVQPTFAADAPGTYVLQLVVSDSSLSSNPDTVVISTDNSPPVANAGPDQTPVVQTMVRLDGTASADADGNPLTFGWSFLARPAGSAAALVNPTTVHPQFLVDLPGTYVVQLMVNDGTVNSAPDTVTIDTVNSRPVANAGADQNVASGSTVNLDGSASSDADGNSLTRSWSFTSRPGGSVAELSDSGAVSPAFVADVTGLYVIQLIVNDGQLDSLPDTVTISATHATNSMALTLASPIVGVGRSVEGTVTLAQQAPSSGVTVTLSSASAAVATVAPDSVSIPAGATQATFTVTGVAEGSTDIVATAAGLTTVSAPIAVTANLISIDAIPKTAPTQSLDFAVSITQPAPPGGLTINFTSGNPAVATVTSSVTVPEGLRVPSANPRITGISIGTTVITAEAANFAPHARTADVTIGLSFSPGTLTVVASTTTNITLNLASPAPTGGLTIGLQTDNPAIATAPASTTVAQGQNSTQVAITAVANGTTILRASAPGVGEATATIVVDTPPINIGNFTIGDDLQEVVNTATHATTLGRPAPPVSGVDVTITSADPARLLVSAEPTTVGTASITLHVNGGATSIPPFVLQALDDSGTVQISATAPGYATDTSTVTLAPSGFVIPLLASINTNTFAANTTVQIAAARLVPGTLNWSANQPVRAGLTVQVPVTSSDTNIGTIAGSPLSFGANVLLSNAAFDPANAGTTTVAVGTPAGFDTPGNLRQITATVTAPAISVAANPRVGEDLQEGFTIALSTAPPGPVDLTVAVTSAAIARVSDNATVLGGTTVTFAAVANTASRTIFLQGMLQGTTTVTVSAPGYATNTQTITVDPSGFVIPLVPFINTNTFAPNTSVQVAAARLVPGTLAWSVNQPLRAGLTVQVPVTSSNATVGTITVSPLNFAANVGLLTTAFDPVNGGTTTIAVGVPAGFDTPSNLRQITATVTAAAINVPVNLRIGEDLQNSLPISLSTAPPTPVDITVTVSSSAVARVSDNATVLGGATVTFPGVANTVARTIFLQGLLQGSTTLTVSAPGYVTSIQTIAVDPSGFIIFTPPSINTTTFAGTTTVAIAAARLNPGTLTWSGNTQQVRAGLTVQVPVTSSDTNIGTMTVSPVSFGANVGFVNTAFDPLTAGTTTIAVGTATGFDTPTDFRQITAAVTAPAISAPANPHIGEDLQNGFPISLTVTPPSPVDITVTVTSGAIARVSDSGTVLGGTTITFPAVANTAARIIFLQGMLQGTTTLTVSAPGYATNVQTISVDPSGFIIRTPAAIITTSSAANANVSIDATRLDPVTLNSDITFIQSVRAGVTVQVTVTSSNTAAGVITVSPLSFGANISTLSTAFDPLAAGSTTITVGPPAGFDTPSNLRQITATVNP